MKKIVRIKLRKISLPLFWQKFRESNIYYTNFTIEMISRNIFSVWENFSFFHTLCDIGYCNKFLKNLFSRNFHWKVMSVKFCNIHTEHGKITLIYLGTWKISWNQLSVYFVDLQENKHVIVIVQFFTKM